MAKLYPNLCYVAPTHDVAINLKERAKGMGINIESSTYHKVFGFGAYDNYPRNKFDGFVLDECSMVSAESLGKMISLTQDNQNFIMAGDFGQLTPVDGTSIYDSFNNKKAPVYEKFDIIELTENWRQKEDPEFFNLCQSLRADNGPLSPDEAKVIIDKLNTRVSPNIGGVKNDTLDDIHICGINAQVDEVNSKYSFIVGAKIMCNETIKTKEGIVPNGKVGILKEINDKYLKIDFGFQELCKFENTLNKCRSSKSKNKKRFSLAHGLTIHKAQGKTIKRNVIINPTRLFSKNHLYVALTRATNFESIHLTSELELDVFCKTVNVIVDESYRENEEDEFYNEEDEIDANEFDENDYERDYDDDWEDY